METKRYKFHYLNIELSKIETLSKKPVQLLNRTDIRVSLCAECEDVFKEISKLYKAIEVAQIKLDWNFEGIQKRVKSAFSDSDCKNIEKNNSRQDGQSTDMESLRHSKLVKELRQEIMERCIQKMPNYLPRVNLEQVPDSVIKKLTDKAQPDNIEEFFELPDQSEINYDETRDFFDDESYPVLCKVSSIKSEQDDHSDDRENEVEADHLNLGDEICKVNSLRQHKKESPLKIQENKTSKKRLTIVSTIKLNPVGARTCHICKRVLATKTKLRDHLRTHTKERPFKCQFCPLNFSFRYALQRHLIVTHADSFEQVPQGWMKYQCKVCGKLFASKYDLKRHLNKHTSNPLKCKLCWKVFKIRKNLQQHLLNHERKGLLVKQETQDYLEQGATLNEAEIESDKYLTSERGRNNANVNGLIPDQASTSQSRSDENEPEMFHCTKCNKKYPSQSSLKVHYEAVHLLKRHKCNLCKSVYTQQSTLKKHAKICMKLIEKKNAREQYAFVCNLCDKRFPGRSILDRHKQRVHPPNGFKPHSCEICGKQYKYLESLKFHKDEVHLGKKLCCKFCKKLYKCSSVKSFKDHEKKCSFAAQKP